MTDEEFQAEFEELRQKVVGLHEKLERLGNELKDKLDTQIAKVHEKLDRIEMSLPDS